MNYESSNGSFSPTTILVPCPNVAPGTKIDFYVRRLPVVLECLRPVASVHRAVADVQRNQLRQHLQRPLQHNRLVHSALVSSTARAIRAATSTTRRWAAPVTPRRATGRVTATGTFIRSTIPRPNTIGPQNRTMFGPNYARRIAAVTDGLSNTLAGLRRLHRPCPDAKLHEFAGGAFRPSYGTWSPTNVPLPGPNSAAALASLIASCGTATGKVKAGGPDRSHALGKWRRVLFRLHDRDAAKRLGDGREPRCRFRECRPELANGLGQHRRKRRRPDLHVAHGEQLSSRRRERALRRR